MSRQDLKRKRIAGSEGLGAGQRLPHHKLCERRPEAIRRGLSLIANKIGRAGFDHTPIITRVLPRVFVGRSGPIFEIARLSLLMPLLLREP